ncbi:four helix bundle protein [bacterium]|nr:four helix bundle protein [bacterium]
MAVEKLEVYQRIIDLTINIYRLTKPFPKDEIYGLTSQMRRAAISIGSNLVEGNYRQTTKDYLHFIDISKGSAAELRHQVLISYKLKYLDKNTFHRTFEELETIIKMLSRIQSSLQKRD